MKLVVFGTNWIGDAVMTIPALRRLRVSFPDSEITLYTAGWAKGIFQDCSFVDRVLSPPETGGKLMRLRPEISLWRKERFDVAVLFTNSFRTALISKLGGAKRRFGFANEGRGFLLSDPFPIPEWKHEKHESLLYLSIVGSVEKAFGVTAAGHDEGLVSKLEIAESRRDVAKKLLSDSGVRNSGLKVGFGAGSQNSEAKRWPAENFAKLGVNLKKSLDADVVLLGSESEADVSARVLAGSDGEFVDLTGKTTLAEAAAVLSELDVFVSNDMGLAHVAAAVGTMTLTVFGPTNPLTTRPLNGEIIRRNDVDCSPCMLRQCPIDHRCMTRITDKDIIEMISSMLDRKQSL